jgi:iron-sulfur cluster assembly protein
MMNETVTSTSGSQAQGHVGQQALPQAGRGSSAPEDAWEAAILRAPKKGFEITAGAAAFGKQKLTARGTPGAAIRLGIKGGGCSGFSYVIQFEDGVPRERDYAYDVEGVRFVIDKKSFVYLAGSVFDYEKTLMFQGFKFRNPNEASSCGCGHSFTVK